MNAAVFQQSRTKKGLQILWSGSSSGARGCSSSEQNCFCKIEILILSDKNNFILFYFLKHCSSLRNVKLVVDE